MTDLLSPAPKLRPFDVEALRAEFPILSRQVNGRPLIYLDSAASAQKPRAVIKAMVEAMEGSYANVHRGLHTLANETTDGFERARESVRRLLAARSTDEIVFTKNGTEAINLVAASFGLSLKAGDEIVVSELEHHANLVPWHFLRERKGVVLKFAPITDDGRIDLDAYRPMSPGRSATPRPSSRPPTPRARRCCWTVARPWCIVRWTSRRWMSTTTSSPATSCSAPPASACSMARPSDWRPCPPIRAAAR
jgi:Aminotransferase class-V